MLRLLGFSSAGAALEILCFWSFCFSWELSALPVLAETLFLFS
jgi:hypothetical protein